MDTPFHYHDPMHFPPRPASLTPLNRWPLPRALSVALATGLLALAGGCAAQPASSTTGTDAGESTGAVVNSSLNAPLFYQLLLGELNVRSGEAGAGYSLILDAARKQKDPQLYRRAVEVALQARSGEAALAAARAWAEAFPESAEPQRFVLQILLALNRAAETPAVLRNLLERSTSVERNDVINVVPQSYARISDKALALRVVREGLAGSVRQRETAATAWTAIGRMELANGQQVQALASAQAGHAADPASPYPALLALELLERGHPEAEAVVRGHLQAGTEPPDGVPSIALLYARTLLDLQRNAEAREQLVRLTTQRPSLPEPWLQLGTLQVQDNALPEATRSLETYMRLARQSEDERVTRGLTQAYLLMAQIAEKQQDLSAANAWLDRIENAGDIMAAQMRRASLLAKQGKIAEARALLRGQPERRPGDARMKLAAEATLLRELKAWPQAYEVYAEAVARFPEDGDLLYEQAAMAEKMGRLDEMERLLRRLIAQQPDYHHAYNALGYALADRGERLPEAKALIEKAVALAPGDAYIQDSLGWVEFRLGNQARAIELLRGAYAKRPDAEIAAHLGEVLWSSGQREQALKVWREGLLLASDNETLQATLKRLRVQP